MIVRDDCRHYLARTVTAGEVVRRCRIGAQAADAPFSCPEHCILFEPRLLGAGWAQAPSTPMSNTADRLADLPPPKKRRGRRRG